MYDDPYQPGTGDFEGEVLSDPLKEEVAVEKEQAPSTNLVTESKQDGDIVSTAQIDAHHIENEGFPTGSYVPGLGIPPQPTSEQFHRIEQIISRPKSSDMSPKAIMKSLSASDKPASGEHTVGKHDDEFAYRSRRDHLPPLNQTNSKMPPLLRISNESRSQNLQEMMSESRAVNELSAIFKRKPVVKPAQQSSSSGSGALIDTEQTDMKENRDRSANPSISSSTSDDLAGLQLQPGPPVASDLDQFEEYVSKDRRHSSLLGVPSGDRKLSSSLIDRTVRRPSAMPEEWNRAAQFSWSGLSDKKFPSKNKDEADIKSLDVQMRNYSLLDDDTLETPGKQEIEKEIVFTDPFRDSRDEKHARAQLGHQGHFASSRSLMDDDDSNGVLGGENHGPGAAVMNVIGSSSGEIGRRGKLHHRGGGARNHSLMDDAFDRAQDEEDEEDDDKVTVLMDPLASGGGENDADRLIKLGGL